MSTPFKKELLDNTTAGWSVGPVDPPSCKSQLSEGEEGVNYYNESLKRLGLSEYISKEQSNEQV